MTKGKEKRNHMITYGPPGHRGVTQLMAVGADEFEGGHLDTAVKAGGLASLALWGFGFLTGNRAVQHVGLGAGLALFGVQLVSGRLIARKVAVTQPAATGCLPCIL